MMMSSSIFLQFRHPPRKICCVHSPSTNINTEQLRQQLDNLHKEAETTRVKANSARMRMMRLSEAAEKLRRQASVNVQNGKENEARELLLQKKKIMQAMEKSKGRIELLDELAAKLYEAISVKETQLIGNVATVLETGQEDTSPVRIVSPNDVDPKNLAENEEVRSYSLDHDDANELQVATHNEVDMEVIDELVNKKKWSKEDVLHSLKDISSYDDFLEHVDQQLYKLEAELVTFLKYSTLILENKEKPENTKVQQAMEILDSVCHIRRRIASITEKKVVIDGE